MGVESLELMQKYFHKVDAKYFHLTSLALVPFEKHYLQNFISVFDFIDRIPSNKFIGRYGWIMAVELSDPIK